MTRNELTDIQWERLHPLLPPQRPRTRRPAQDHRRILNGMYWILRTGAPWRDLPEAYGPWQTVATRFYRWVRSGLLQRLLGELQRQAAAAGDLDWDLQYVDGTVIRAHQHAAGAKKGGQPTTQPTKRSGGVRAASAPKSICGPREEASR